MRVSSKYVPNKRFSKYSQAISAFLPFRRNNTSSKELPNDTVGCFTNSSFSWTRNYRVTTKMKQKRENLPSYLESLPDEKLLMPKTLYSDSCTVNGSRFIGILKNEEQSHGQKNSSMFRVAWKFCSTRAMIATFIYSLAILIALIGPVIFLKISLNSMEYEKTIEVQIRGFSDNKTNEAVRLNDFFFH